MPLTAFERAKLNEGVRQLQRIADGIPNSGPQPEPPELPPVPEPAHPWDNRPWLWGEVAYLNASTVLGAWQLKRPVVAHLKDVGSTDRAKINAAGGVNLAMIHPWYHPWKAVVPTRDNVRRACKVLDDPTIDGMALDFEGHWAHTRPGAVSWLADECAARRKRLAIYPKITLNHGDGTPYRLPGLAGTYEERRDWLIAQSDCIVPWHYGTRADGYERAFSEFWQTHRWPGKCWVPMGDSGAREANGPPYLSAEECRQNIEHFRLKRQAWSAFMLHKSNTEACVQELRKYA